MFLHLSVILFNAWGVRVGFCHTPRKTHPPGRHPPGRPPGQTPPLGRHLPYIACWDTVNKCRQYASYWNAILFWEEFPKISLNLMEPQVIRLLKMALFAWAPDFYVIRNKFEVKNNESTKPMSHWRPKVRIRHLFYTCYGINLPKRIFFRFPCTCRLLKLYVRI